MFGQIVAGRSSSAPSSGRCFRYEVAGLHQSEETDKMDYQIRSSASVYVTVPYERMNEEMRRITRMGGTIVSIEPLNSVSESENSGSESEG